jgi:nucleoid-associated protein YgaU
MTIRRLLVTGAAMAAFAGVLRVLAPPPAAVVAMLGAPQHAVDTAGPGGLVLAAAGGLAWIAWAWGCLGLLLTAATTLPGAAGGTARLLMRGVLPAGCRRTAALALGMSVALQSALPAVAAVPVAAVPVVPDWPSAAPASGPAVPDWPEDTTAGSHVVVPGDCLWNLAAGHLRATAGRSPSDAEIVPATRAWWTANTSVIGDDPDLILPGQVLHPPAAQ